MATPANALDFAGFRARHGALVAELFGQVREQAETYTLDAETFLTALWRSIEKSKVAEDKIAAHLRALRIADVALAAACVEGSAKAWEILLETLRAPLRAAGRSMAGDRGEELADSLFGELYAKRASKLASYAGRSSLAGWLRAVLQQSWIDRLRSEKHVVQMDDDAPEPAAPPAADAVEQSQNARIVRGALASGMAALPPRQKLLLDFYYSHGLTLREAAALVGVHEATASRELDRARAALKSHLTEILRREHRLEAHAAEALLLNWDHAQETAAPSVLLKERL